MVLKCRQQDVKTYNELLERMLLSRPNERYSFINNNYLHSAVQQDLEQICSSLHDVDFKFQRKEKTSSAGSAHSRRQYEWRPNDRTQQQQTSSRHSMARTPQDQREVDLQTLPQYATAAPTRATMPETANTSSLRASSASAEATWR